MWASFDAGSISLDLSSRPVPEFRVLSVPEKGTPSYYTDRMCGASLVGVKWGMTTDQLCLKYKKTVGNHEIHITVTHTGARSFSVVEKSAGAPSGVASGTIHWGSETPVRYHHGSRLPTLEFGSEILRASYDMYRC